MQEQCYHKSAAADTCDLQAGSMALPQQRWVKQLSVSPP
jgi:hypothetical protein